MGSFYGNSGMIAMLNTTLGPLLRDGFLRAVRQSLHGITVSIALRHAGLLLVAGAR